MQQKSMFHHQTIHCLYCVGRKLQKNGKCTGGSRCYYCKSCRKQFRVDCRYNAYKPGVKEKIIGLTLNSSGFHDMGRVLSISKDTIMSVLKKTPKTNPYFLTGAEILKLEKLEVEIRFEGEA